MYAFAAGKSIENSGSSLWPKCATFGLVRVVWWECRSNSCDKSIQVTSRVAYVLTRNSAKSLAIESLP